MARPAEVLLQRPGWGVTRLAFVIPWRDRGRWLWEFLPDGVSGDLLFAAPETGAFLDKRRLPPYIGEWWNLWRRRVNLGDYDVVFAWEMRCAVAVALLQKARGKRGKRTAFVPVGPILKGPVLRALPVVRHLMRDANRIVCFSRAECADYARLLQMPPQKFVFLPTPWTTPEDVPPASDNGYILSLGQSGRDYPTLLQAARGTDLPIVIVAGNASALGSVEVPSHVTVKYNTGHEETNALIAGATLHCIPLKNEGYSAGQTVLLRAMAQGKAVVVSDTAGVRDYVRNNETAVLVPPGDAGALRAALLRLWNDASERERIGKQAARAVQNEFGFARFTEHLVRLARDFDTISTGETKK